MRLRVQTESDTYLYATSPFKLGGFSREDVLVFFLPMVGTNTLVTTSPFVAIGVGVLCLVLYKKATAKQPDGFIAYFLSANVGKWLHNPFVRKIPPLRIAITGFAKLLNKMWLDAGLLPSPTYCNLYER
jgi:hypothetical protein